MPGKINTSASTTLNDDLSIEIAWLHYVGGMTQADIAERRGISKATVHRLIKSAHDSGNARVIVETKTTVTLKMEKALCDNFGLKSCLIAPSLGADISNAKRMNAVGRLGARFLLSFLEANKKCIIGLGSGRTLGTVAKAFPRINRENAEFVSLAGDFSVFRTGRSLALIQKLAEQTNGTAYSVASPIIADSAADREVLMRQRGTRLAFAKAAAADFCLHGIGHLGEGSFFTEFNLTTQDELNQLKALGVVADFTGNLLDKNGRPVDCDISNRMVSCSLDTLRTKKNYSIGYGAEKVPAMLATLRSGFLTGLATDLDTAQILAKSANL